MVADGARHGIRSPAGCEAHHEANRLGGVGELGGHLAAQNQGHEEEQGAHHFASGIAITIFPVARFDSICARAPSSSAKG